MKIWLDLANSPQVLFFRPILAELARQGQSVTITTRAYAQTTQLADGLGLPHTVVGRHGGQRLASLALENYTRALALTRWAAGQHFDLAVSHNSYSQALAAGLLRVPFVTLMDYEHHPLNHLAFRLARRVIVPKVFPQASLEKFGAARRAIRYAGIKEQVYLADFVPGDHYRRRAGLPESQPLIVVRPPAPWTAYLRHENSVFDALLEHLLAAEGGRVLFLPRLPSQAASVRHLAGLQVASQLYDGPNLLYHADLVISGGGTMNREAAVLGTPTFTVFQGKLGAVDRSLIERGRMRQITSPADFHAIAVTRLAGPRQPLAGPALVHQIAANILSGEAARHGSPQPARIESQT